MRRDYVIGMVAGWALWLTLIATAYALDASERFSPHWVKRADLPDTLATVLIVAALPVKYGGWLFIWGDDAQPSWATGLPFNALVGLTLYGALGIAARAIYSRRQNRREVSDDSQVLH